MKKLAVAMLALALACPTIFAQSAVVSQISGTVVDSSGLAVAGAEITATQTDTGAVRTATSGNDGGYLLPSLAIGPYRIEVKHAGFTTYVQSGVVLQVNTNPSIDVTLKVGSVTEKIVVEAAAAMVETHSTGVGQVVDQQRVVDLPLNGRQATDLILLAGASASLPASGNLISTKNYPGELLVSVAGGGLSGLTYLLDGGTHNDPFNNLNLPLPFPDALQEFKVETSALPAQYGHHSAGAVNSITKSGGNQFHGDAFEFVRNGSFNARDTFALSRDSLKRNQFGGTIGGPILHNKLFFFAGYQNSTLRSAPSSNPPAFLPTPKMLTGDFTDIASAACNSGTAVTLKAPFVGNKVPMTLLNASAVKMTSYYPVTNDPCGKILYTTLNNQSEYSGVTRVDYQKSANHSLFVRYYATHSLIPSSFTGTQMSVVTAGTDDLVNSIVFGDTFVFGSNKVNSFRATYNRSAIEKNQVPIFSPADLGVNVAVLLPHYSNININNAFTSAGGFATPGLIFTNSYQLADDFSWVRGSHQIAFGVNAIRPVQNGTFYVNPNGLFTFTGQITGLPLSDFLLGNLNSYSQNAISRDLEQWQNFGMYVQDSWRINNRLTVNYGIRWEPYIGGKIQHGQVSHFDEALFINNVHSVVYPNAPAGTIFPGDAGFDTNYRPHNIKWNDFAPRFGLVWDPKGDGRMTVRASWGMFYDMPNSLFYYSYTNNPPWGGGVTLTNPAGGFSDPFKGQPGGNPFPVVLTKNIAFPTGGAYLNTPLNPKVTYLEQWNLSVQRQIGSDWLASATYLGNNTVHGWVGQAQDPAIYIPGSSTASNVAARRVLTLLNPAQGALYGSISNLDDGATGSYNALLLALNHRLARHFTVLSNYTWSHCISDPLSTQLAGSYSDPFNRRFDRGNCAADIRHILNISAVLESPKFANRLTQALAGNWKVSPIFRATSGMFFNVTSGTDTRLIGIGGDRPNLLSPNIYCDTPGPSCWLNKTAFQPAAVGLNGGFGINAARGPGYFDVDLSVSRQFVIRERHRIEVRAESFNIQNRVNYNNPGGTFTSGTFGKITTDRAPRIMQFAMKYYF